MKKSELKEEIFSKINLEIEDSLFYMPGEKIKGQIKLNQGLKISVWGNKLHFNIKLVQYEFWDYLNMDVKELKNIYKTEIKTKSIEYILKEEEKSNKEENLKLFNEPIILIEKKEEEKKICIPFEFEIDDDNYKLLPTFQYETDKYFLGIRHLLVVESKEYPLKNFIGLFIGKNKDNNYISGKEIEQNYQVGLGTLNIKIKLPKQSYYFGEQLDLQLKTDSKLLFKKVTKVQQKLEEKLNGLDILKIH